MQEVSGGMHRRNLHPIWLLRFKRKRCGGGWLGRRRGSWAQGLGCEERCSPGGLANGVPHLMRTEFNLGGTLSEEAP